MKKLFFLILSLLIATSVQSKNARDDFRAEHRNNVEIKRFKRTPKYYFQSVLFMDTNNYECFFMHPKKQSYKMRGYFYEKVDCDEALAETAEK